MATLQGMLSLKDLAAEELASEDPLPSVSDFDPAWTQAEAFRKAGEYERAGPFFFERWKEEHEPGAGWRYAYCLRKAGHPEAALRVACRVLLSSPDDKPSLQEKLWSLYEARVKPAIEAQKHQQVLQFCLQMAESGADELALKLAAFASFKAAKESRQWAVVLEWCDRLDLARLSTAPRKLGERKSLSDRERYYYAKIKALIELKEWELALAECEQALSQFERNQDFLRWQAHSLNNLGDRGLALQRLADLRKTGRCRWYILTDYARLLLPENSSLAWEVALDAAAAPVEDSHKLGLFELMAQICLAQNRDAAAADHVGWCMALRAQQGWPGSPGLEKLEVELHHFVKSWEPNDPGYWKDRARLHWGLQGSTQIPGRRKGQIEQLLPGRNYCFVLESGQRYYALVKDVPTASRQEGSWVGFRLTAHYDAKKQSESQRAIDLTPA